MYCSDLQFCLECTDQSLLPGEETLYSECISLYASHVTAMLLWLQEIAKTHTGMTNQNHLVIIPGAPVKYMSGDVP